MQFWATYLVHDVILTLFVYCVIPFISDRGRPATTLRDHNSQYYCFRQTAAVT